jgi:hypothetical protein
VEGGGGSWNTAVSAAVLVKYYTGRCIPTRILSTQKAACCGVIVYGTWYYKLDERCLELEWHRARQYEEETQRHEVKVVLVAVQTHV